MNTNILNEIAKIQKAIRDRGAKKEGKGNYSKIYSLDQLQSFIREYGSENLSFYWGRFITSLLDKTTAIVEVKAIWKLGDDTHEDVISMAGSDLNNISFAAGKAITYGKRYYLAGMLGLGSEDLEPDNPELMKNELIQAITRKFEEDEALYKKLNGMWLEKYKTNINLKALKVEKLSSIARQIGL